MAIATEEYNHQHKVIKKPPYQTASRKKINIRANIELPEEIDFSISQGAEGIGFAAD